MDDPDVVRKRVADSLGAIEGGAFEPTPGQWCRHCDFRAFCDAGKHWLAGAD